MDKTSPKSDEILLKKDQNGNKILEYVPHGTLARIIDSRKGINYASMFDLRQNVYNVRKLSTDNLITFRPPHSQELKIAVANAHEADPYLKRATEYRTEYVFGGTPKPFLVPLQEERAKSKKENEDAVKKIISKTEFEKFMKFIRIVDSPQVSNIYAVTELLWNQSYVYGTTGAWKVLSTKALRSKKRGVDIPVNTPVELKLLDGYYITNIHQDIDNWSPQYLEYTNPNAHLDLIRNEDDEEIEELTFRANTKMMNQSTMLPWDRLFVVRRPNFGTTPNTYVYGISPLLAVLYISENVRRIDEKILPELNEGMYAGVGIFTVPNESKYDIDMLANALSNAGTKIVLNEEVKYQAININYNMDGILNQKMNLIKSELMALGIPESLFFPANINRATLEIIINIWQNISLDKERQLLKQVMWNFWYKDLMKLFFQGEELITLALTVDLEFRNRSFTSFVDKAAPLLQYHMAGVIPKAELREDIDHTPFSEYEDDEQVPFPNRVMMPDGAQPDPAQQAQTVRAVSALKRGNSQTDLVGSATRKQAAQTSRSSPVPKGPDRDTKA